jgi:hypothetical protein
MKMASPMFGVGLKTISDLEMPSRVAEQEDSNEDTRVVLQLKILRRNDAGADHGLTLEYDSGKSDAVTIIDNLQKGAGKLSLTANDMRLISYAVGECKTIARIARDMDDD